jgi:hypothetical protein
VINGKRWNGTRRTERGVTLLVVALGLAILMGAAMLAIDLASLYVARDEAQRAADAGALAGAKAFVQTSCVSGLSSACGTPAVQSLATNNANAAAGQNAVGGKLVSSLSASCVGVTFPPSSSLDPLVSVTVSRNAACGNAMPTYFGGFFGYGTVDVSATATAEAYNPSGTTTGPTICAGCVKPFLMPNCDPVHTSPANPSCGGGTQGYFINPSTGSVVNPGPAPGGVIGQQWLLHTDAAPSQWYLSDVCGCGNSGSCYRTCIQTCSASPIACGTTLNTVNGKKVGPTDQGIDALINASGDGPGNGQDTIDTATGPPFPITGGANNPNPALVGKVITSSPSLVTVPIYDGHGLNPGGDTVTVVGYMQMFVQFVTHKGTDDAITVIVLGVTGCGTRTGTCSTSGSSGGTITGGGGALFPIRLVRNPGT